MSVHALFDLITRGKLTEEEMKTLRTALNATSIVETPIEPPAYISKEEAEIIEQLKDAEQEEQENLQKMNSLEDELKTQYTSLTYLKKQIYEATKIMVEADMKIQLFKCRHGSVSPYDRALYENDGGRSVRGNPIYSTWAEEKQANSAYPPISFIEYRGTQPWKFVDSIADSLKLLHLNYKLEFKNAIITLNTLNDNLNLLNENISKLKNTLTVVTSVYAISKKKREQYVIKLYSIRNDTR